MQGELARAQRGFPFLLFACLQALDLLSQRRNGVFDFFDGFLEARSAGFFARMIGAGLELALGGKLELAVRTVLALVVLNFALDTPDGSIEKVFFWHGSPP